MILVVQQPATSTLLARPNGFAGWWGFSAGGHIAAGDFDPLTRFCQNVAWGVFGLGTPSLCKVRSYAGLLFGNAAGHR